MTDNTAVEMTLRDKARVALDVLREGGISLDMGYWDYKGTKIMARSRRCAPFLDAPLHMDALAEMRDKCDELGIKYSVEATLDGLLFKFSEAAM